MTTTMTDLQTGKTFIFNDALPGRDAYEEALALGFEGTRAEWIASLRGLDFDPAQPNWENDRTYPPRAAVIHQNSFWFARVTNQTVEPGTDDDVWMKLVHGEDAATLGDAVAAVQTLLGQVQAVANAPVDEAVPGGGFSASHHRIKAQEASAASEDYLALTIAASQALTPISVLHDLAYPIPAGWWDTQHRLSGVTSLLGSTSSFAIISNWQPWSLFAGRIGAIWDISEAGTGVTWGSSVATIADLSPNEQDAAQANTAQRGSLGRVPVGGRRNLARRTSNLLDALWTKSSCVVGANPVTGPFGTLDAWSVAFEGNSNARLSQTSDVTLSLGQIVTASVWVRLVSGDPTFRFRSSASGQWSSNFQATSDWQRFSFTFSPATSTSLDIRFLQGDGITSVFEIWGPQVEIGAAVTPFQRAIGALDVTEAGVPSVTFLRLDLSDDRYATTFAAGGTFDVLVAGRGGIWVERDVVIAPGGSLTVGPDAINGLSPGVLSALGGNPGVWADIVGVSAVDRAISGGELAQLLSYYKARGAGDLMETF